MDSIGLEFEKPILEIEQRIAELKELASLLSTDLSAEIEALEKRLMKEKRLMYSNLTPWQKILIVKQAHRPQSLDYIDSLMTNKVELFGDRIYGDDPAIISGLATFRGSELVFLADMNWCFWDRKKVGILKSGWRGILD
jgi:acetyl-CoA carboxylase carboxyl transferase subunit alpha